ncbi:MAG TPA: hypothetical protein VGV92_03435 [Gammaproteobacteria bacterium]|nr:hypothetical protein [Gammaproteobacteria bacterium]
MKKILMLLTVLSLSSCAAVGIQRHENDYARLANVQPVSKIPPGSLLSQQVRH